MKKYLITGGFGYVGSWVAKSLALDGNEVHILSRKNEPLNIDCSYRFIEVDLTSLRPTEIAKKLPKNLAGCVHAASFNETFLPRYAEKSLLVNALGTKIMLDALYEYAKIHNMPTPPLFIYCSTFHVYGADFGYINEETPPAPRNDYALTHFFGEEYCHMAKRVRQQPFIITRLTNGYGAPLNTTSNKWYLLLNDLCKTAFCTGKITLRSNPSTLRDFVWLGDVAKCLGTLLLRTDMSGETFCIAASAPLSIKEIALRVIRVAKEYLKKDVELVCEQPETTVPPLYVDAKKIKTLIHFTFTDKMDQEIVALFHLLQETEYEQR